MKKMLIKEFGKKSPVGNIDNEGHYRGWKLPQQMETILADIVIQVHNLLD